MYARCLGLYKLLPSLPCCPSDSQQGIMLKARLLGDKGDNNSTFSGDSEDLEVPTWMRSAAVDGLVQLLYRQIDDLRKPANVWSMAFRFAFCCNTYQFELRRAAILASTLSDLTRSESAQLALLVIQRELSDPKMILPLDRDKSADGKSSHTLELLKQFEQTILREFPDVSNTISPSLI